MSPRRLWRGYRVFARETPLGGVGVALVLAAVALGLAALLARGWWELVR